MSSAQPPHDPQASAPHQPADDEEIVYFDGSPSARGQIGKFPLFALIGAVLFVVPFFIPNIPLSVKLISCAVGLVFPCLPMLKVKTTRFRITNYRIDYERGILGKNIDTLELWHVEDIKFHQSLLDRILGVGNITILSHDESTPELLMFGLPDSRNLYEQLKQRVIAVKRQRGVIKMDVG
jgi:hypothetical protein